MLISAVEERCTVSSFCVSDADLSCRGEMHRVQLLFFLMLISAVEECVTSSFCVSDADLSCKESMNHGCRNRGEKTVLSNVCSHSKVILDNNNKVHYFIQKIFQNVSVTFLLVLPTWK